MDSASDEFQRAISPLYSLHTSEVLFLSPQKVSQKSLTKVAQICWIMDTGECLGNEFGWSDDTPGGGTEPPDFDEKGPEDCIKEGYTLTSCPEGKGPSKVCMYDNRYFAECVDACPADFKECKDPYYGVGEECDGMYRECQCDYCVGYDYTAEGIPNGYVADGDACNSCNGPRYKIKPNPCYGYMECEREPAKNATTCLSGDKLLYSDCNDCDPDCPAGTTETNPEDVAVQPPMNAGIKPVIIPMRLVVPMSVQVTQNHRLQVALMAPPVVMTVVMAKHGINVMMPQKILVKTYIVQPLSLVLTAAPLTLAQQIAAQVFVQNANQTRVQEKPVLRAAVKLVLHPYLLF